MMQLVADRGVAPRDAVAIPVAAGDPRLPTMVDTRIAAGPAGRRLAFAEAADGRWQLTVDGAAVELAAGDAASAEGGQDPSVQQALLPAAAAQVTVSFHGSSRRGWLWAQAIVVSVAVVLALPSRRRDLDDDEDDRPEVTA